MTSIERQEQQISQTKKIASRKKQRHQAGDAIMAPYSRTDESLCASSPVDVISPIASSLTFFIVSEESYAATTTVHVVSPPAPTIAPPLPEIANDIPEETKLNERSAVGSSECDFYSRWVKMMQESYELERRFERIEQELDRIKEISDEQDRRLDRLEQHPFFEHITRNMDYYRQFEP